MGIATQKEEMKFIVKKTEIKEYEFEIEANNSPEAIEVAKIWQRIGMGSAEVISKGETGFKEIWEVDKCQKTQ